MIISTAELDPNHDAADDYRRHTPYVYSPREHGTMWVRMYDNRSFELWNAQGRITAFVRQPVA